MIRVLCESYSEPLTPTRRVWIAREGRTNIAMSDWSPLSAAKATVKRYLAHCKKIKDNRHYSQAHQPDKKIKPSEAYRKARPYKTIRYMGRTVQIKISPHTVLHTKQEQWVRVTE